MKVVELFDGRVILVEVRVPDEMRKNLARDGLPDVIEYKGQHFVRVFDGSHTPRYVRGEVYHAD